MFKCELSSFRTNRSYEVKIQQKVGVEGWKILSIGHLLHKHLLHKHLLHKIREKYVKASLETMITVVA